MRIIDYKDGSSGEPCVLLLGYFDGVHIGHRALIAAAKEIAAREGLLVGLTTFYDGKNGGQIFTFSERCTLLASLGVDFVYAAQFDAAFRATEGTAFLEHVCAALPVRAFVCGEDYTYGRGAACGVAELSAFAAEHGIALYPQPAVAFGSEKAAATLAKQYLREGDMPRLAELLSGRYFITGTVATEGRHVGRKMGFPTANIHVDPEKYPLCEGVYAVSAKIGGKTYRGIANYGARPTFGDARIVLESFFDGFTGDLYGRELTVYFDFYIRPVRKFENAEELAAQLRRDLETIR